MIFDKNNNGILDLRTLTTLESVGISGFPTVTDALLSGLSNLSILNVDSSMTGLLRLYIDGCTTLNTIVNDYIPVNLVELHAKNTGATTISLSSQSNLSYIDLSDSIHLEEIVFDDLNALVTLDISNCPALAIFSLLESGGITSFSFPSDNVLSELTLSALTNLAYLNLSSLSLLQSLVIGDTPALHEINLNGLTNLTNLTLTNGSFTQNVDLTPLSSLTTLTLQNTPNVVGSNLNLLNRLPSHNLFKTLSITLIDTLINANVTNFSNIESLSLTGCELLESITATGCSFLRDVLIDENPKLKSADFNGCSLSVYTMTYILERINGNGLSDGIIDLRMANGARVELEALPIISELESRGYTIYKNEDMLLQLLTSGTTGARWNADGKLSLFDDMDGSTNTSAGNPIGRMTDQFGLGNDLTQPSGTSRPILFISQNKPMVQMDLVDDYFEWPFDGVLGTFWFLSVTGAQCFTLRAGPTMPVCQFLEAGFIDRIVTDDEYDLIMASLNNRSVRYHDFSAITGVSYSSSYVFGTVTGIPYNADIGTTFHIDFEITENTPDIPPWAAYGYSSFLSGAREYADIIVADDDNLLMMDIENTYGQVQDLTKWPALESYSKIGWAEGTLPSAVNWPSNLQALVIDSFISETNALLEGILPVDFSDAPCAATLKMLTLNSNLSGPLDITAFTAIERLWIKGKKISSIDCSNLSSMTQCYLSNLNVLEDDGINVTGCTNATEINIDGFSESVETLNLTGFSSAINLGISGFPNLTTVNFDPSMQLTSITLQSLPLFYAGAIDNTTPGITDSLIAINLELDSITSVDVSNFTNLVALTLQLCPNLETINAHGCTNWAVSGIMFGNTSLKNVDINGCQATSGLLEILLSVIYGNGFSDGTLDFRVQGGITTPTTTAYDGLIARGYTILTN